MVNAGEDCRRAHEAIRRKAGTYCIVASGRRPTDKEVNHVIGAVKEIRETTDLKICCCLGFLNEDQAGRLAEAGVHRYNHNLNTHANNYDSICSTHTYDDRVDTVQKQNKRAFPHALERFLAWEKQLKSVLKLI